MREREGEGGREALLGFVGCKVRTYCTRSVLSEIYGEVCVGLCAVQLGLAKASYRSAIEPNKNL